MEDAGTAARPSQLALTAFVEGLGPETSKESLREHFADCGKILLAVVATDVETGNHVGKVKFSKELAVQKAIEEKSGTELDGRRIVVQDRAPATLGEETFGAAMPQSSFPVFVSNLHEGTSSEALKQHFSSCGKVVRAHVASSRGTSQSHGNGRVEFSSEAARRLAVQSLHESELDGRRIVVKDVLKTGGGAPIFVGGLRPEVTTEDLREHFGQSFTVLHASVQQLPSGLRKGCGKVVLATDEDRSRAIKQLHGSDLLGSTLTLREFLPTSVNAPRRDALREQQQSENSLAIFTWNLPLETTTESLKQHFSSCGQISSAALFRDREGRHLRKGKLVFAKMGGYRAALNKMNFSELDGGTIMVRAFDSMPADKQEKQEGFPILVGNFGPEVKASALAVPFQKYGRLLECRLLMGGNCKIEFASEEARRLAIAEMNGFEMDGKALSVREMKPQLFSGTGLAILVSNLSYDIAERDVKAHIERFGEVTSCILLLDRETAKFNGRARVEFASRQDKEAALAQLPNTTLRGRQLDVRDIGSPPGPSVFVAGLPQQMTAEDLRKLFSTVGEVKDCKLIRDTATGRSKGTARVEFVRKEGQQRAIQELHLYECDGRAVTVREYLDSQAAAERSKDVWPVLVSGLSPNTTVKGLAVHFQVCGGVRDCRILTNHETGRSRGLGRIDFQTEAGQSRAVAELHGTELDGYMLKVRRHDVHDSSGGKPTTGFSVFVTSLPFDTPLEAVREHFSQVGTVLDVRLLYGPEGRPKGTAKVSFVQEKDAHKAVAMLNESEVDGRIISVRLFMEQGPPRAAVATGSFSVFVSGLSLETTQEALRAHFSAMGTIRQCTILKDQVSGKSRGLGRVEFSTEEAQRAAIVQLNRSELHGRALAVKEHQPTTIMAGGRQAGSWVSVSGLGSDTKVDSLRRHFRNAGSIVGVKIVEDRSMGISTSLGKIEFASAEAAVSAIAEFNNSILDGKVITLQEYNPNTDIGGSTADLSRSGRPTIEAATTLSAARHQASRWTARAQPKAVDPAARKVDPDDDQAYTFAEISTKYAGRLSEAGILDLWTYDCSDAPSTATSISKSTLPGRPARQ